MSLSIGVVSAVFDAAGDGAAASETTRLVLFVCARTLHVADVGMGIRRRAGKPCLLRSIQGRRGWSASLRRRPVQSRPFVAASAHARKTRSSGPVPPVVTARARYTSLTEVKHASIACR